MATLDAFPSSDDQLRNEVDMDEQCAPIRETAVEEVNGLFRFAWARLGRNAHRAEDAVQQALLVAMAHSAPPSRASAQRAWLRGIVRNVIRRQMRSWRRGQKAMAKLACESSGTGSQSDEHSALRADDSQAGTLQRLCLAVTELDQADQDLFYAFYRTGRSHASLAEEFGSSSKAIEARLYRLRLRLRAAMERCGERPV